METSLNPKILTIDEAESLYRVLSRHTAFGEQPLEIFESMKSIPGDYVESVKILTGEENWQQFDHVTILQAWLDGLKLNDYLLLLSVFRKLNDISKS